ncbi:hypothetical protein E2C06_11215 [Dankookia rubra]|uniref:Uncharacterized protein n=1 Tax=Dankookia rubra TaxID=1442381 RepID=A0A4R5QGK2_9PROT|nr:hypothetical protein [Dankookia rubra]TDH62434.1 hypothetical protein E2C06_11215 [Dankookia rubra]
MYNAIIGHITGNLWLWTGIGLGISALAILISISLGKGYYLAEIITLGAMFGATTMILASQKGMVHAAPPEDEV